MTDANLPQSQVSFFAVTNNEVGQRLDNFLIARIKGVPKSLFYRLLRKGQIRVNKKRVKPDYRLNLGDEIRLPPLRHTSKTTAKPNENLVNFLKDRILYEDEYLLILNKPAGIAVHAGTQLDFGLIDAVKALKPECPALQLAHRLDRDTSGCLVFAKNRLILNELQALFKAHSVKKIYLALTKGHWQPSEYHVDLPLLKIMPDEHSHQVVVHHEGQVAITDFYPKEKFAHSTLMQVSLMTGRTHQIRVHAAHLGHPVAGDEKYGDWAFNKLLKPVGLRRIFLHAQSIEFTLASINKSFKCQAPLDDDLLKVLEAIKGNGS